MKAFLVVVGILILAGTAGADYKECRQAYRDKQWDQAFEACHAEALKADNGEGDKRAFLRVAHLYMRGRGTGRDYNEAMRWFRKAADRGSGRAMSQIGYLYKKGWGVTRDEEAALRWYKKSAETGDYLGQYNYGINLVGRAVRGLGTQTDVVTGYMYLILSKEQNRGSVRFREEAVGHWMGVAENHLTYSEIDEAKRRARKWKKVTE